MTTYTEATMFYWTTGSERHYHTLRSCMWLSVALWDGAQLVESVTPPADAAELVVARKPWPRSLSERVRWLCRVCALFVPDIRPVAWDLEIEPCAKCTCPRKFHERWRGPIDMECWMAWAEYTPDEEQVAMLHCLCDGYVPYRP
jgi:hypothetical protein